MGKAKDILLRPISAQEANDLVKRVHYSGKVVNNSQLHIGVYYHGKLEGAMQFGPSLDKRKIQGLVTGTAWHEFIELNRLAFTDVLPRNSESRALAIAMKLIKKHAPQVKWVVSFADGTQCGDGTIYRAAGFVLTGIKKNDQLWAAPTGTRFSRTSLTDNRSKNEQKKAREVLATATLQYGKKGGARRRAHALNIAETALSRVTATKGRHITETGGASMKVFKEAGFRPLDGFQLRYIYFVDPSYRARLTVPELPYSAIAEAGARMYKGERLDMRPVNGDNPATSEAGRFDSDPAALDFEKLDNELPG